MLSIKQCSCCHKLKDLNEFVTRNSKRLPYCKECEAEVTIELSTEEVDEFLHAIDDMGNDFTPADELEFDEP